jgi:hypothetical protein
VLEVQAPTGGAGDDQPVQERGGDPVIPEAEEPPRTPATDAQGSQPDAPLVRPASGELAVGLTLAIRIPVRRRAGRAASAPRPLEIGAASSSAPDAEATSAAPPDWMSGGGTGVLNAASQEVLARFNAQGAALQQYTQEFLATRAAVRICFLFSFLCNLPWGRASVPIRCSPRVPGRLLSRQLGTSGRAPITYYLPYFVVFVAVLPQHPCGRL